MKKITIFLVFGFLVFFTDVSAQQDPHYTQYMYNMNVVNPAYAGSRGTLSLGLLGRMQWLNIDGAPRTYTFDVHAPLGQRVGMGFSVIADQIGPVKEQNIYVDLSYTIQTSDVGRLAFGLKGGVSLQSLDGNLIPPDSSDDDLLEPFNNTYPNFGAGIYYYTDKFYIGGSVPNILSSKHYDIDKTSGVFTEASEEAHYFLTSGYVFDLSSNLKFKPSVMLRGVVGSPLSYDVNANFLLYDRFELGASYRDGSSVSGLFNIGVTPDFRIGYAIDFAIGDLANLNPGTSHELMLLYDIDLSKKNLKSPRFF